MFEPIKKLNVLLNHDILMGQLRLIDKSVVFKYADSYLKNGSNISPFKLKWDDSAQISPPTPFNGLHGVFADSLPDAWGTLLLKKHLSKQELLIQNLNSLDLLYLTGNNSTGALTYEPIRKTDVAQGEISIDALHQDAQAILEGEGSIDIEHFFKLAGSPGGAKPKVQVTLDTTTETFYPYNKPLSAVLEPWIVKFSARADPLDLAHIEYAYNLMANDCGIESSPFRLFKSQTGTFYFGSKRFDIVPRHSFHVITAAALTHDDYEKSTLDYGHLLDSTQKLTSSALEVEKMFRLACFNVLAHNRDDHSKNFSFLMDSDGNWKLSPAYDLTFSSSSQGMHSTSVDGNAINPSKTELLELSRIFSIKKGEQIFNEVSASIQKWMYFSEQAHVTQESAKLIADQIVK
jgi:serine/threonine-protein kinase HipA